jgi:hypothetical protein
MRPGEAGERGTQMQLGGDDAELYDRTALIARQSREAAQRAADLTTRLSHLDVAEQKTGDLLWLDPVLDARYLRETIERIREERRAALGPSALAEIAGRLEIAAGAQDGAARTSALRAAGQLLTYCVDELGATSEVRALRDRLTNLGGDLLPRKRPAPLRILRRGRPPAVRILDAARWFAAMVLRRTRPRLRRSGG